MKLAALNGKQEIWKYASQTMAVQVHTMMQIAWRIATIVSTTTRQHLVWCKYKQYFMNYTMVVDSTKSIVISKCCYLNHSNYAFHKNDSSFIKSITSINSTLISSPITNFISTNTKTYQQSFNTLTHIVVWCSRADLMKFHSCCHEFEDYWLPFQEYFHEYYEHQL